MHSGNCTDESAEYQASGGAVVTEPEDFELDKWIPLAAFRYERLVYTGDLDFQFRVPLRGYESPELLKVPDTDDLMLIPAGNSFAVVKLSRKLT